MAFKTTTIFHFWSSNSAQPSSHPYIMQTCDCLHYHVFTCVVRLTHMFHVWVPRRRLYDSSALHIVGGNYTHIPPVPSIALVSLRSLRLNGCRLGSVLISTVWGLYPLTSRLDVLHTFPATICVRLVGIPCALYRTRLFFPLRLEGGTILHVLTLVSSFSSRPSGFFSRRNSV